MGIYTQKTDNELRDLAREWAMTRAERAAQEWSRYALDTDPGTPGQHQLTAPARWNPQTEQTEQAAWCCNTHTGECDCPDYAGMEDKPGRLLTLRRELWRRGLKEDAAGLRCKHVQMIPHLLALAEEQAQEQQSRERYADDLSSALDAALAEIERLKAETAKLTGHLANRREQNEELLSLLAQEKQARADDREAVTRNWDRLRTELRETRDALLDQRESAAAWRDEADAAKRALRGRDAEPVRPTFATAENARADRGKPFTAAPPARRANWEGTGESVAA